MPIMTLTAELELACSLAREAGAMALKMQHSLSVRHKAHGLGPVSNADLALDKFICHEIAKNFPDDEIISEESFVGKVVNKSSLKTWFIDPIDGTSSYILGREDFVIMIGLAYLGEPKLGVIFQPASDTLWWGLVEHAQKASHINSEQSLNLVSPLNLIVSRMPLSKKASLLVEKLRPLKLIQSSSFGLKAMKVMQGDADLYLCWARHIHLWDTCAPSAIMKAHNAYLTFLDNKSLAYEGSITHGQALVASRLKLAPELRALLVHIDQFLV